MMMMISMGGEIQRPHTSERDHQVVRALDSKTCCQRRENTNTNTNEKNHHMRATNSIPASRGEKIQIQMRKILTCVQQTLKPAARREEIQIQIQMRQMRKILTCVQQTVKPAARGDKIDWEVEAAVHSQEQVGHLTTF